MPPPPKRWSDLTNHPFGTEFKQATRVEINKIVKKGCFLPGEQGKLNIAEVLPLIWVFTYKFNENGFLQKFKARLVVRGDLQTVYEETYTATLAVRVFRFLIALIAAFSLKAIQYNVLNAFLNAKVQRDI